MAKMFLNSDDTNVLRVVSDLGLVLVALLGQCPTTVNGSIEEALDFMKNNSFKAVIDILSWEHHNTPVCKDGGKSTIGLVN